MQSLSMRVGIITKSLNNIYVIFHICWFWQTYCRHSNNPFHINLQIPWIRGALNFRTQIQVKWKKISMSRHRARLRLETVEPRRATGMSMKALSVLTASNARAILIHSSNGPRQQCFRSIVKFLLLSYTKYLDFYIYIPST